MTYVIKDAIESDQNTEVIDKSQTPGRMDCDDTHTVVGNY